MAAKLRLMKNLPSRTFSVCLATCLGLAMTGCQQAPQRDSTVLTMQQKISFPDTAFAGEKINEQCDIPTRLADDIEYYTRKFAQKRFAKVQRIQSVSEKTPGMALSVQIVILKATGGGRWAGDRYMNVEGTLWEHGNRIGSFVARRESWDGNNSCMSLIRISRAIGEDVGRWLAKPKLDSRLGDWK